MSKETGSDLPVRSRFVSEDPIGRAGGDINVYAYVGGQPITLADPTGTRVYFGAIGLAVFSSESPASDSNRGVAVQSSIGIAYDTESGQLILYKTTGVADPKRDVVMGMGVGFGPTVGVLHGSMGDLLGTSRERTEYKGIMSVTDIETSGGKRGFAVSVGGKGFGWGYTSNDTYTSMMLNLKKKKSPCR